MDAKGNKGMPQLVPEPARKDEPDLDIKGLHRPRGGFKCSSTLSAVFRSLRLCEI
jgi:hypothetical protein